MKLNPMTQMMYVLFVCFSVAGCISRKAVVKNTFLIEAHRTETSVQAVSPAVLAVHPFSIAPAFQGCEIVFRIGENQFKSDYYNEYFVLPAQMITEQTRNWLSKSGLFARVLSPMSSVRPGYVLEGHISRLFLDVTDSAQRRAVLEITFFLVKKHKRDETVDFEKTYTAERSIDSDDPGAYIRAQSEAMQEILEKLEKDLAAHI